ncbi:hypothetical protein RGCCGE502_17475 [Rhizobium grahamii CCGE 502]|uniref:Uncharacterized protein n=1 Tax=Rhizobium grahamii CCGE 502 TaxID=990285 RepID=S3HE31_9HYPH|nr:hypothetical protein RGCCGE502_17475 [Rhizobium grahamii CCGE 502]
MAWRGRRAIFTGPLADWRGRWTGFTGRLTGLASDVRGGNEQGGPERASIRMQKQPLDKRSLPEPVRRLKAGSVPAA